MNPSNSPSLPKKKGIIPAIMGVVIGMISSAVGVYFGYLRPILESHGTITVPPGFLAVVGTIILGSVAGVIYLLVRKRKGAAAAPSQTW